MPLFNRVVCAVDFSAGSERALKCAVHLARLHDAAVAALYVHQAAAPVAWDSRASHGTTDPPLHASFRAALLQATRAFAGRAGPLEQIDCHVAEGVDVPAAIVEGIAAQGADLTVFGTHGRSGGGPPLGSVSARLLRIGAGPMLTVPGPRSAWREVQAADRVVCAVDLTDAAAGTIEAAAALARALEARLTVLHVIELPAIEADESLPDLGGYRAARFASAHRRLSSLVTPTARATCEVHELLLAGRPHREIVRLAREQDAALVVLGPGDPHGEPGYTADRVCAHATCPVLVLRGWPAGASASGRG